MQIQYAGSVQNRCGKHSLRYDGAYVLVLQLILEQKDQEKRLAP